MAAPDQHPDPPGAATSRLDVIRVPSTCHIPWIWPGSGPQAHERVRHDPGLTLVVAAADRHCRPPLGADQELGQEPFPNAVMPQHVVLVANVRNLVTVLPRTVLVRWMYGPCRTGEVHVGPGPHVALTCPLICTSTAGYCKLDALEQAEDQIKQVNHTTSPAATRRRRPR